MFMSSWHHRGGAGRDGIRGRAPPVDLELDRQLALTAHHGRSLFTCITRFVNDSSDAIKHFCCVRPAQKLRSSEALIDQLQRHPPQGGCALVCSSPVEQIPSAERAS